MGRRSNLDCSPQHISSNIHVYHIKQSVMWIQISTHKQTTNSTLPVKNNYSKTLYLFFSFLSSASIYHRFSPSTVSKHGSSERVNFWGSSWPYSGCMEFREWWGLSILDTQNYRTEGRKLTKFNKNKTLRWLHWYARQTLLTFKQWGGYLNFSIFFT